MVGYDFFLLIFCSSVVIAGFFGFGTPLARWLYHYLWKDFDDERKAEAYVNRIMGSGRKKKEKNG